MQLTRNNLKLTPAKQVILSVIVFLILDLLSFVTIDQILSHSIIAIIISVVWLMVAVKDKSLAVILLLVELIIGSFGRLFSINFGSTEISLRVLLFILAFGFMIYKIASDRKHIIFSHRWRWYFILAAGAILATAARGYYNWNDMASLILDVNGYLYILLLPLFLEAYESISSDKINHYLRVIIAPAIIWLSIRTVVILYLFTHIELAALAPVYHWYRDSGLGEITPAGGGFFRVFSQSHLYSSLAAILGLSWLWSNIDQRKKNILVDPWLIFTLVALVGLLASLSRSLWLGATAACLLLIFLTPGLKKVVTDIKFLLVLLILVSAAAGVILSVSKVNWPMPALGSNSAQAFSQRFGNEAASQSRLALLTPLIKAIDYDPVLGRGFGATVTYFSTDPRIVRSTAGGSGLTTTYAFEWGYLDLWYKFGLIGLTGYLVWILYPWLKGLKKWRQGKIIGAAGIALTALLVTHITTPYLNHPLGLGAVLFLGTAILTNKVTDKYEQI